MLALLKFWQIGVGAALGAMLAFGPVYFYGKHAERADAKMATAIETAKSFKERAEINDKIETLDAIALCLELGGLPDECTVELRRVAKDQTAVSNGRIPRKK